MIKVSITEYKTNSVGEIDRTKSSVTYFETLDLKDFDELLRYVKLLNPKKMVNVRYENGERYISIVSSEYRKYIKII